MQIVGGRVYSSRGYHIYLPRYSPIVLNKTYQVLRLGWRVVGVLKPNIEHQTLKIVECGCMTVEVITYLCLCLCNLLGLNLRLRCLHLHDGLFSTDVFCDSFGNGFLLLGILQFDLGQRRCGARSITCYTAAMFSVAGRR